MQAWRVTDANWDGIELTDVGAGTREHIAWDTLRKAASQEDRVMRAIHQAILDDATRHWNEHVRQARTCVSEGPNRKWAAWFWTPASTTLPGAAEPGPTLESREAATAAQQARLERLRGEGWHVDEVPCADNLPLAQQTS